MKNPDDDYEQWAEIQKRKEYRVKEFRSSIDNLIRSDRPESPTNLMFVVMGLWLVALWIYATLTHSTVPHIELLAGFIFAIKVNKSYQDRKQNEKGPANEPTTPQ